LRAADPGLDALKLGLNASDMRPFAAPWQAQAFALAVSLHERGVFTWSEWAAALSHEIHAGQSDDTAPDDLGDDYYRHWLAAIERLVAEKGIASVERLAERRAAWERAAHATPHGAPILIENDPNHPMGRSPI
jgi:nitrile hydratase accessory protein